MKTKFKRGQKVWSIQLGDCEVVEINAGWDYPIKCKAKDDYHYYDLDGKFSGDDASPSLFSSNPFFDERVMEVSDDNIKWEKRVVFMQKNGKFLSWLGATNIEDSKCIKGTCHWQFAREISAPQIVVLTLKDISEGKGVGVPVELIRIKD